MTSRLLAASVLVSCCVLLCAAENSTCDDQCSEEPRAVDADSATSSPQDHVVTTLGAGYKLETLGLRMFYLFCGGILPILIVLFSNPEWDRFLLTPMRRLFSQCRQGTAKCTKAKHTTAREKRLSVRYSKVEQGDELQTEIPNQSETLNDHLNQPGAHEDSLNKTIIVDERLNQPEIVDHGLNQSVTVDHGLNQPVTVDHCLNQPVTVDHCLNQPVTVDHCLNQHVTVDHC
ncbi:unnamed protein product, partial [Lymnaea stagnalis]